MTPIVRHIGNNQLYEYLGDNKFRNIVTKKEGVVDEEKAREVFRFNLEATQLAHYFPLCKELIEKLNMQIDKQ